MAKRPSRPKPDDPAAISRKLRSDSQALRDAEWWVRRRIYGLSDQEARRLFDLYMQTYRQMAGTLSMAYGSDGSPDLARRAQLLRQLEAEMATLAQQTGISLDDALVAAYQQGYAGRAWALDMATNPDVPVRLRPVLPPMQSGRRYCSRIWARPGMRNWATTSPNTRRASGAVLPPV